MRHQSNKRKSDILFTPSIFRHGYYDNNKQVFVEEVLRSIKESMKTGYMVTRCVDADGNMYINSYYDDRHIVVSMEFSNGSMSSRHTDETRIMLNSETIVSEIVMIIDTFVNITHTLEE